MAYHRCQSYTRSISSSWMCIQSVVLSAILCYTLSCSALEPNASVNVLLGVTFPCWLCIRTIVRMSLGDVLHLLSGVHQRLYDV